MGQYYEGNTGFDDVSIVVVAPQKSELNTKYKSALLNWRGEMSRLGFGLDLQGRLLSEEAVAGDPTEGIWFGICKVSWLSWAEQKPRRSQGCARGNWPQHYNSPPGWTDTEELSVCKGDQAKTPPPPNRTDRDIGAAVGTGTQGVDGAEKSKMGQ